MSILSDSFKSGKYVYDALNINENNISKGTPSLNMVKEVIKNHFKLSVISKNGDNINFNISQSDYDDIIKALTSYDLYIQKEGLVNMKKWINEFLNNVMKYISEVSQQYRQEIFNKVRMRSSNIYDFGGGQVSDNTIALMTNMMMEDYCINNNIDIPSELLNCLTTITDESESPEQKLEDSIKRDFGDNLPKWLKDSMK